MSVTTIPKSHSHSHAKTPGPHCRVCGCSEDQACLVDGLACSWIAPELCDFCSIIVGQSLLQGTFPDAMRHLVPWLLPIFTKLYDSDRFLLVFADLVDYCTAMRALMEMEMARGVTK